MKKALPLLALALIIQTIPANAMGSGDKYQDFQTGVTYVVYKPSPATIKELPPLNFEVRHVGYFPSAMNTSLPGLVGWKLEFL